VLVDIKFVDPELVYTILAFIATIMAGVAGLAAMKHERRHDEDVTKRLHNVEDYTKDHEGRLSRLESQVEYLKEALDDKREIESKISRLERQVEELSEDSGEDSE